MIRTLTVAIAASIALAGSCLLPKPMSPEERKCANEANANMPDLTGSWETKEKALVDIRHSPSNRSGVNISIAAGSPTKPAWVPETSSLRSPQMVQQSPPICGTEWKVAVSRSYPERKAQPGQFVSTLDQDMATVSEDRNQLVFANGEVWTRVGAVGELAVPKPGVATTDLELGGTTLHTIQLDVRENAPECFKKCEADARCAAAVHHERTCTLQSSLGPPRERARATAWINPAFDPRPPPSVPLAGQRAGGIQLGGTILRELTTSDIPGRFPNAERECAVACDAEWSCAGFSANTEGLQCQLFQQVSGAKRAGTWASRVQPPKVAERPREGGWSSSTQLSGRTLRVVTTQHGRSDECTAECDKTEGCVAVSYFADPRKERTAKTTTCELKTDLGEARPAQHWSSWRPAPRPAAPTGPPDQTMSSPLCKDHLPAFPARTFSNDDRDPRVKGRHIDVAGLVEGKPPTAVYTEQRVAGLVDWTRAFYVRGLPNGNVHIHVWYKADLVLKRDKDKIVVGPVDESSEWRLEHLWEHVDRLDLGAEAVVIRSAQTGQFLASAGSRLELRPTAERSAHWGVGFLVLPAEGAKAHIPMPIAEPEPLILDQGVLEALTNWSIKEYFREQQPSCWKKGGKGACPSGQSTNCGLFCAQSTEMCVLETIDMVQSVTDVALNLLGAAFTGGTATAGLRAVRAGGQAAKSSMRMTMRSAGRAFKANVKGRLGARVLAFVKTRGKSESFKKLARDVAIKQAKQLGRLAVDQAQGAALESFLAQEEPRLVDQLAEAYAEEVSRRAAERIALKAIAGDEPDLLAIAAAIDPTGISAVVDAFVKPTCEQTPMPDL